MLRISFSLIEYGARSEEENKLVYHVAPVLFGQLQTIECILHRPQFMWMTCHCQLQQAGKHKFCVDKNLIYEWDSDQVIGVTWEMQSWLLFHHLWFQIAHCARLACNPAQDEETPRHVVPRRWLTALPHPALNMHIVDSTWALEPHVQHLYRCISRQRLEPRFRLSVRVV